jgi:UDP-glucose 4-epimerase
LATLDIDWVALRPVLVYGPGMKGNFAALAALARSPYPLPFAGLKARRSLLSVDNLVDVVEAVLVAPAPLRRAFVVAEPEALTVPEMISAMRRGLNRKPGIIAVPNLVLKLALATAGRSDWYERLAFPLVAGPSALLQIGWKPKVSTATALQSLMKLT